MLNHLYILLKLFPDKGWNYKYISQNPNLNMDIILSCDYDEELAWFHVTENSGISFDDIKQHPDLPWSPRTILCKDISLGEIMNNISLFRKIAGNHTLPPRSQTIAEFINENDLNFGLSSNKYITWEFIKEHSNIRWSFPILINNKCITYDIIKNNQDYTFRWINYISCNPNITWQNILNDSEVLWDYKRLSSNENIPLQTILNNPDKEWYWDTLVMRRDMTWEIAKKYLNKISMVCLSRARFLTWEIIIGNPHLQWDMVFVSSHANITFDIIFNHPNFPWDLPSVSDNPNLTYKIILDNPDFPWDWNEISGNWFNHHGGMVRKALARKYYKIWRHKTTLRAQKIKQIYDPVLDMLRLRIRDYELGLRSSLTF